MYGLPDFCVWLTVHLLVLGLFRETASGECYNPGPAFPKRTLTTSEFEKSLAGKQLNTLIHNLLSRSVDSEIWSATNTSLALQITSSDETVWEYYHTAPQLGNDPGSEQASVSGDTVFRIASVSKTFTVYALLREGINLDDPITKYLPELREKDGTRPKYNEPIDWDQISLRSMASQLSGVGRGTEQSDLALPDSRIPDPQFYGLPSVPEDDPRLLPHCGSNATERGCNAAELLQKARKKGKIFPPNDRSTYSNIAFSLLGLVLENVTGMPYADVLRKSILNPLGMNNTSTVKPNDSAGIIPAGKNDWAWDLGSSNPTGGIYSTANDLSTYLRSLLMTVMPRHRPAKSLLHPAVQNAWFQPHSFSSSGHISFTGMPWEMLHTRAFLPHPAPLTVLTKSGSLGGYYSMIVLIPSLNVGLTILTATPSRRAVIDLSFNLVAAAIPLISTLTSDTIAHEYNGTYAQLDTRRGPHPHKLLDQNNNKKCNANASSITIAVHPTTGVTLTSWTANGQDFLDLYGYLKGMPDDNSEWSARLIPTGLIEHHQPPYHVVGGVHRWFETWRLMAVRNPPPPSPPTTKQHVLDEFCISDFDALQYGGESLEEFRFGVVETHEPRGDEEPTSSSQLARKKKALVVYISGMRAVMARVSDDDGDGDGDDNNDKNDDGDDHRHDDDHAEYGHDSSSPWLRSNFHRNEAHEWAEMLADGLL